MKEKKHIHEIYWIRATACLTVVMIHALTRTYATYDLPESTVELIRSIQILLLYATPMFILISEVVIANVYSKQLPKSFFKKRFLFLFLPYVFTPFLYGFYHLIFEQDSWRVVKTDIYDKLFLGAWHGYFIIIILQFVIIHFIFIKFFKNVSPWIMLTIAFLLNIGYLFIANFKSELLPPIMQEYLSFVRMPFIGWIFYFTVAYYVGRYFAEVKKNRSWGLPLAIAATAITSFFLFNIFTSGTYTFLSSVRLDIMFYTISLFFVLLYLFSYLTWVPRLIMFISKYSFPIFLLHYLAFNFMDLVLPEMNIRWYALLMFVVGVLGSILMARLINLFPFGKYIVGPIRRMPKLHRREAT